MAVGSREGSWAPSPARVRVLAEIEEIVEAEPFLAGPGPVAVPYRTDLFWAERRGPIVS